MILHPVIVIGEPDPGERPVLSRPVPLPADNHRQAAEVLRALHDAAPLALPLAA